jgi:hypothetical protein
MSEIGHCATKIIAERLGKLKHPESPMLEASATEGNWHEERLVQELEAGTISIPRLGKVKVKVHDRQQEQKIESDNWILLGHIDGRGTIETNLLPIEVGLEFKSMAQYSFDRWLKGKFLEFPEYKIQLTCYKSTTKVPFIYIVKNRNYGYVDVSFIEQLSTTIDEVKEKVAIIDSHVREKTLYHSKEFSEDDIECSRCRFSYCLPDIMSVDPEAEDTINKAIISHFEALKAEKLAKLKKADADFILMNHCVNNNLKTYRIEGTTITRVQFKRKDYDGAKLRELIPEALLTQTEKYSDVDFVKVTNPKLSKEEE